METTWSLEPTAAQPWKVHYGIAHLHFAIASSYRGLTDLQALESESIHILCEVAAECRHPALLFSGGKDSVVLLRLAERAFRPACFPFPLLHIDTVAADTIW